jgi:hypothetical protein
MKSDLNIRFIELHRAKKANLELLQAMCRRKYRGNIHNNIGQNMTKYCGLKLSLDKPGPRSKYQHLKTIIAVSGEKAYHFLKYNGNMEQGTTEFVRDTRE